MESKKTKVRKLSIIFLTFLLQNNKSKIYLMKKT